MIGYEEGVVGSRCAESGGAEDTVGLWVSGSGGLVAAGGAVRWVVSTAILEAVRLQDRG